MKRQIPERSVKQKRDVGPQWRNYLAYSKDNVARPTFLNAIVALSQSIEWNGKIARDDFSFATILTGRPPYELSNSEFKPRNLTDNDLLSIAEWLQMEGIFTSHSDIEKAVKLIAEENAYHPVRDYLSTIKWDGQERIHDWMRAYMGVEPSEYVEAVAAKMLISAVARVMTPGCQCDSMVIIEGEQGIGKSSAVKALMPDIRWYTDDLPDISTKDAPIQIQGIWILEHAELAGSSKKENEAQKAFITRRHDRFRPPFGSQTVDFPRQTIFIGTTNQYNYMTDETGGRRYWPVKATKIDPEGIEKVRDQLWAEAVERWKNGEKWHLTPQETELARHQQAERYDDDVWTFPVLQYAAVRECVFSDELLSPICLNIPPDRQNRGHSIRVGAILRRAGYTTKQFRSGPNRGRRAFIKPENHNL